MRTFKVIERLLMTIPIMLGVTVMVFLFMRMTPGDPVDALMGQSYVSTEELKRVRHELHLDVPVYQQLALFFEDLAHGDLGTSYQHREPVAKLLWSRIPATTELALGALLFALLVSVPIGLISAVKQNSAIDRLSMAGAFLGISMPAFWLGILMIFFFGVKFHWLPVQGRISHRANLHVVTGFYILDSIITHNKAALISSLKHLVLPSVSLGAAMAAIVARVLRSSMLEALRSDYVTLARAKGVSETMVIMKHALRNALIPTVTVVGLQLGVLLGGNMIVETVFSWPGLGRLVVESIFARDFPVVQGAVMLYALTYVVANLAVDILYTYLNPKITL